MSSTNNNLTRRTFLQSIGAATTLAGLQGSSALFSQAMQQSAADRAKKITLLEDGGFTADAWGWQFTSGATIMRGGGPRSFGAVHINTQSGDYARFLVLGPVAGKTYTLTGWVRTEAIIPAEPHAGAYFSASQFEFQGRPTEFTVDGKQAVEIRYANLTGTSTWQRFTQSVKCLPTSAWFEVVVGLYRASGQAWFSGLTFVEGDQPAELEDTLRPHEAAELAHQDLLARAPHTRRRAAILDDPTLPIRGAATPPHNLGKLLAPSHDITYLNAAQLNDLTRDRFDLLVLPCGETFPFPAKDAVLGFLANGGDLLTSGGYAFQSPVVQEGGNWRFFSDVIATASRGENLLPALSAPAWKSSNPRFAAIDSNTARLEIPAPLRNQSSDWTFDVPATGEGTQFHFSARIRTQNVLAASDGLASIGVEQLDANGYPAYAARLTFAELRGSHDWQSVERTFYLVPDTRKLRVKLQLANATGVVEATSLRLEHRPPQIRINTALGWPEDSLTVKPQQLGVFDPSFPLQRVARLSSVAPDGSPAITTLFPAEGYAATGVVGMDHARWLPVLEALDADGRRRGAAGAMMHHHNGPYARSSWAYFGVDNHDVFTTPAGERALAIVVQSFLRKSSLHALQTSFSTYRDGEPVRIRVLVSNYGLQPAHLTVRFHILDGTRELFARTQDAPLRPGQTLAFAETWQPPHFDAPHYAIRAELLEGSTVLDTLDTGFNAWHLETLHRGMPVQFRDNYFQVEGRSVFLQGTDDYLHTFIDQDENAGTWLADAQGCRDAMIDVYENLMGLRGPQHRPTETWWRWVDAMLLNTQSVGGIFFPGMLVFSNTAVSQPDLDDQRAYVRAFADRYREANGIMYYLNGDLELHDPNLPNLQVLYNDFLRAKYGTDEALRAAWHVSPPEKPLGQLTIHRGKDDWNDVRTLDDFQFRTSLVRRWLNALHDSIREVDTTHPVTAEFYQSPVSGIDLLTALGKLELANFGYFNEKDEDFYRFPQTCRFLDQSLRGKGINVGEFGVKTHPAWNATGYYIEARTEQYEQSYFLSLSHWAFALGASKIQNWCWKYPADLPFEWGLNYSNDLVPRDVLAFYRNSGLLFRWLRPRFEPADTVVLFASDARMGGQGQRIVEGQLNAVRLLLDQNLRFATLTDEFLTSLPANVKTILYPLPYCPSDEIIAQLTAFVQRGGQLYLSGDLTIDGLRNRTKTNRLRDLCGLDFVSERYPNLDFGSSALSSAPADSLWPKYEAAPTLIAKPAGASILLADVSGNPLVSSFTLGQGRVLFSADPIELHGDPRYQQYAHDFYRALLHTLNLPTEPIPQSEQVHCLRVPSQDDRQIQILVNHGDSPRTVSLPTAAGTARLSLNPHYPGAIVSQPGVGLLAVESSGDVTIDNHQLLATNLHIITIAFQPENHAESLATASRILLLPMAAGSIALHTTHPFRQPTVLIGQIENGRWRQLAARPLTLSGGVLHIDVNENTALSMLLLCEEEDREASIAQLQLLATQPWQVPAPQ